MLDNEQTHKTPEGADLEDLLNLAVTVAEYQDKYREFAASTLEQEFKLAKVLRKIGIQEES